MKFRILGPLTVLIAIGWMGLALPAFAQSDQARQRDSDDFMCHHGRLDDQATLSACSRLWGRPVAAVEVQAGRRAALQRDSDDYVCHHGRAQSRRTLAACSRLWRMPVEVADVEAVRETGRQRDSDDYNCHHGPRGDPRTTAACARLRGDHGG
ncbi:MAG: hypothetical protein JO127_10070 [Caulobacteraceae bacterium]|nr:hypothetical protein [Caulobacteraceae bacterium]